MPVRFEVENALKSVGTILAMQARAVVLDGHGEPVAVAPRLTLTVGLSRPFTASKALRSRLTTICWIWTGSHHG